jgi:protein-L-isoaspartate O-methyltransferase
VKIGDGYQGWPDHAPFDAIIVTCAPTRIPEPLKAQLAEGGRMVIPSGEEIRSTITAADQAEDEHQAGKDRGCSFRTHGGQAGQALLIFLLKPSIPSCCIPK